MKIEVPDDFRVQERDRVGGDGIAEAGMEFLGDRRAADNRPALKHGDFEPGGGEIGGRDKRIVAPADDDDVAQGGRQTDQSVVSGRTDISGLARPGPIPTVHSKRRDIFCSVRFAATLKNPECAIANCQERKPCGRERTGSAFIMIAISVDIAR
jgi:hypothetical protein